MDSLAPEGARYDEVARTLPRWEITPKAAGYPPALLDLERGARTLRGIGDATCLLGPCISIVGARRATPYGLACARLAGRVAAECGVTVVSGGAYGCDYEASRSALDAGGKTVIIPGCGADRLYPRTSDDVFCEAASGAGCVVSVERWGTGPMKYTFVRRNAYIAALSRSLVVCEAGRPSGTFGTATRAADLGRRVYAAPGSIFSATSRGTNWLIETGAAPIADESALEQLLSLDYGVLRLAPGELREESDELLRALTATPMLPDELARHLGLSVSECLSALAQHEVMGRVQRLVDGRFSPTREALLGQNGSDVKACTSKGAR